MRLSLWQQFSSNHSASFTVVGKFETAQKAMDAERTLKTLFEDIQLYWAGVSRADKRPPSWAELEASQTYGIEWDKSLDWLVEPIDRHVMRFERYVFITTALIETYQCSDTIEQLMLKLADSIDVARSECGQETLILLELKCTTPSEQVASEITEEIRSHFSEYSDAPIAAMGGQIQTLGREIHILEIAFFSLEHGIPALVEYLKSRGCTDITYTLQTVPYASKPEYI